MNVTLDFSSIVLFASPPAPLLPPQVKLGKCKLIEEIMIGEDRLIHFSGEAGAGEGLTHGSCGPACGKS